MHKRTEYPPRNWSLNSQLIEAAGCLGKLPESCQELIALGCDKAQAPPFYKAGLQPDNSISWNASTPGAKRQIRFEALQLDE